MFHALSNVMRSALAVPLLVMTLVALLAGPGAEPARAASGLSGVVTVAGSGAPLAGVAVEVLKITVDDDGVGGTQATSVTDARGRYSFPDLRAGDYVIGLSKRGFVTSYTENEDDPWQAQEIAAPGVFDARLHRAAELRGSLADAAGRPVSGSVTARPAFHDSLAAQVEGVVSDGEYAIAGLLPGRYTVEFVVDGHATQYAPRQLDEARAGRYALRQGTNRLCERLLPASA